MKSIMDIRKAEEKKKFLKLFPLESIETMHNLVSEIISLKSKTESVSEYEIYKRYLKKNPRNSSGTTLDQHKIMLPLLNQR